MTTGGKRWIRTSPYVQESFDGRFRVVLAVVADRNWYTTFERQGDRWVPLEGRWPSAMEAANACEARRA